MEDAHKNAALRRLPSVDALLASPFAQRLSAIHPRALMVEAARRAVAGARQAILDRGEPSSAEVGERELTAALRALAQPKLRRVLNATGVVLHTGLGRAPLAEAAIARIGEVARGYANLELELDTGERGSRYAPVEALLRALTGAEAAMVVNNGAGAVLLALAALAAGKEVVVSRGEAVEIGGGFRVPEVMAQSGAALVEVGTTNKTRLADYERAITDRTGLILKVHRSNFAIVGFTEEASVAELAQLASVKGVPVFQDLGSGALAGTSSLGFTEPTVREVIAAGADLVAFSGDKLLGGPQAGILAGRAAIVRALAAHPLYRALRVGKLTVAALEATLELHARDQANEIPALARLAEPAAEVERRAARVAAALRSAGVSADIAPSAAAVGAGASPLARVPSSAVALPGLSPDRLAAKLRAGDPSVVARIEGGMVRLDLRCIPNAEVEPLVGAVGRAVLACAVPEGQG